MSDSTPRWYAVCIGINQYAPSAQLWPLRYAEADAQAMDALLADLGFPAENRCLLLGENATLDAINTALEEFILNRPGEEDVVLFYFAGHSTPLQWIGAEYSEVFLSSYDFDPQQILCQRAFRQRRALGMNRLRNEFFIGEGARKRFFLFDSCYSGDFLGPEYRGDAPNPIQGYLREVFKSTSAGRVALSSCLPTQPARESQKLQHGIFTYYVLEALSGRAAEARHADGWITVNTLFEYLVKCLPEEQRPVLSGIQHDTFALVRYASPNESTTTASREETQAAQQEERLQRLRLMLADHTGFLHNRLQSFVGRATELAEIGRRIEILLPTGGYVTITGQAGQGKSSIIAKLVEQNGVEHTAFHFIPLNPGPDHQVGLLRNLLAHLILKYNLSDLYVASESRPALRDAFFAVLKEIAAKGGQERIFIDGLDQLEEEINGVRDLSFLPPNPPAGIILILGTRPNDTLRPLELLKPHDEYPLPNLSRDNFTLILQRHQIILETMLADRFYAAMEQNALYLDLVAQELRKLEARSPESVIADLTDNPENLFSLATDRFKRQWPLWKEITKPVLGVLLVAQEPLSKRQLRQLLAVDADSLNRGLEQVGGLVICDEQYRYSLYHLKFRDFLTENPNRPLKKYIFAQDEVEQWHQRLSQWGEGHDLIEIWQDCPQDLAEQERRVYARSHYLTHLYYAQQREQLWAVLDDGIFGRAKLQHDPSMRSYALDLAWGERAAAWEGWSLEQGIAKLPMLWRYTLLRCRLASRADSYPEEAFHVLLLLGQEAKAFGLVELLTDPLRKVQIFLFMARILMQQHGRCLEAEQLMGRAMAVTLLIEAGHKRDRALKELARCLIENQWWQEAKRVIATIQHSAEQAQALRELASSLAENQQWQEAKRMWQEAERVIATIQDSDEQAQALSALASSLTENQQWQEAERVIATIQHSDEQAQALSALASSLVQTQQLMRLLGVIQRFWRQAKNQQEALSLFPLAFHFFSLHPPLGRKLHNAFAWVETFLQS